MNNLSQVEQAAKEVALNLERNPTAKNDFLRANHQNSIWMQCPPQDGGPVNSWSYGIPIPGAEGFLLPLGDIWYNSHLKGWTVCCRGFVPYLTNLAIDEAKKDLEEHVNLAWEKE